jgi:alkaline phosphatase D
MAWDQPDLILHLGDYIYEGSWGRDHVRKHNTPEAVTLDDYRARHALYKSDPDLQAAHAACPWLVTWDDHEVENDYAAERSENLDTPEWFLARRAAAYKAWYEHMPVPRRMLPVGPHARIYTRFNYANLAAFFLVDNRQHRTPQPCPRPGRGGGSMVDIAQCAELADPQRSLLGTQQEKWLEDSLGTSRQPWNVLAQQTLFAQLNRKLDGAGRSAWTDGWDGYPAARRRLLDLFASRKVPNPVVIGGDVHAFYVSQLKADFDDPKSPVVASEFVGTSISSQHGGQDWIDKMRPNNPHILLAESRFRGYTRVDVTRKQMQVDLRGMETVQRRDAPCRTLASFVVEDGKPGPVKAE